MVSRSQAPVARWIRVFCGCLVLIGTSAGLALLLVPEAMFPGLDFSRPELGALAQGLAGRSLTMALAVALATILRDARAMLVVLVMRLLTELQDMITSLAMGRAHAVELAFIATVMVLELAAVRSLWLALRRTEEARR